MNKNVVKTISHREYKDVWSNKKCLKHSMNRIESNNNRLGTYKISKVSLFCIGDKMFILNNVHDILVLGY